MRLSASNIAMERGGRELFAGLSFVIESGEALVVTGPNGAGKSSLLRAIAGFLRFSLGAVSLQGGDPGQSLGEQAHYLAHADALKNALTVRENLEFWAGVLGAAPNSGAIPAALAQVGLANAADFSVGALSAGQKRRVALARLLAAQRPLWLLDEPMTALDAPAQAQAAKLMQAHLAAGGLIVAATHAPLGLSGARELRLGQAQVSVGAA